MKLEEEVSRTFKSLNFSSLVLFAEKVTHSLPDLSIHVKNITVHRKAILIMNTLIA